MLPFKLISKGGSMIKGLTAFTNQHRFIKDDLIDYHLYPTHIPTTNLQKTILTVGSGVLSFFQPWRQDLIATFGETSASIALSNLYNKMKEDEIGSRILRERPRIRTNVVDLNFLRTLPKTSFGRHYVDYMDFYKYSPDERMEVSFIDNPDHAYILLRYREVHDLVHVLLNQPTDMLGEVVVKWFEGIQTHLPMCVTGGFFGSMRLKPKQRGYFVKSHLNYAIRAGYESKMLLFYYFEKNWEKPIDDVRKELNIPSAPSPTLSEKISKRD